MNLLVSFLSFFSSFKSGFKKREMRGGRATEMHLSPGTSRQPDKHAVRGVKSSHTQDAHWQLEAGRRGSQSGQRVRTVLIQHFHVGPPGEELLHHLLQTATSSQVERPTTGEGDRL